MAQATTTAIGHGETPPSRRDFLYLATGTVAVVGAASVAWPLIDQMNPDADTLARGGPIDIDLAPVAPGQQIVVKWQEHPIFIVRRTPELLKALKEPALLNRLRDPDSQEHQQPAYAQNWSRSIEPDVLVLVGVCTHLGCIPNFFPKPDSLQGVTNWPGGYFCPCHGSKYDLAGTSAAIYAAGQPAAGYRATPEAVKEAMVLFDGSKTAVAAYFLSHDFRPPVNNDSAQLPPADLLSGKFVRRVSVHDGVITADLRAGPNGLATAGSMRLIPQVDRAGKRVGWSCESRDIVNIQALEPGCRFNTPAPAALSGVAAGASSGDNTAAGVKEYQFNMSLQLVTDGAKASHTRRATLALCAEVGKTARFHLHDFDVGVMAIPDGDDRVIMNLDAGGTAHQSKYLAVRRMGTLGQRLHLDGNLPAGQGHFSLEVTPLAGCPARAAERAKGSSRV